MFFWVTPYYIIWINFLIDWIFPLDLFFLFVASFLIFLFFSFLSYILWTCGLLRKKRGHMPLPPPQSCGIDENMYSVSLENLQISLHCFSSILFYILYIYLSIYLSIYPNICLFILRRSIFLSIYPLIHIYIYLYFQTKVLDQNIEGGIILSGQSLGKYK